MNINNTNLLNNLLYNNLSKNIEFEIENNKTEEDFEKPKVNKNTITNSSENLINSTNILSTKDELEILLSTLKLPINKDNLDLINLLIKNGISVNKNNIQLVSNALKSFKNFPLEKAILFIENNINSPLSDFKEIQKFLSNDIKISSQIENILNDLENIDNETISLNNIFKNTNIEQLVNTEIKNINNLKLNIFNTILNKQSIKENINLKNIDNILEDVLLKNNSNIKLIDDNINNDKTNNNIIYTKEEINKLPNIQAINNENIPSNLNDNSMIPLSKPLILNKFLDFLFKDNLIINSNKLNIVDNLLKNVHLDKTYSNDLKLPNNFINKDDFMLLEKELFNFIKNNNEINLKFKNFIDNSKIIQNKIKHFNIENSSNEDLEEFFKDLSTITKNLKNSLQNTPENNNVFNKNIDDLSKSLDFMSSLKDSMFLQIPLNINNFSTTAELFIFSNKKGKNAPNKNKSGSALLSLNLEYLGKLDTYIYKHNNNVSCQFRLEKEICKNLIKENTSLLEQYLKNKNLILKEISFKNLEEPFTIFNNTGNKNIPPNNNIQISSFSANA